MSLYTVGEIFVWLLIAAVLGGLLGWLLRGLLLPTVIEVPAPAPEPEPAPQPEPGPEPERTAESESAKSESAEPAGTIVRDVDVEPRKKPAPKRTPVPRTPPADTADARSRVAAIAKRTAGRGKVPNDDLVLVHGIGPKIARLLDEMDITSFRQIARLTDDDIEDITAALEAFPGRIERDDWKGSARELHRAAYGTDPLV
jgi:predicted flap endonuclease-1-like 5' DNA nuclease